MILGKGVSWKFKTQKGSRIVLDGVDFSLGAGKITAFIGKSGAGKTTLLRCVAQLLSEYEGSITSSGQDLKQLIPKERASRVGFVSQQFHLFPHLTVLQNCTYALKEVLGVKEGAEDQAKEVLDLLGMLSFVDAFPLQLSGGQQQRVAIARALVLKPEVLLLDEPTSALDPESKKNLESILMGLQAKGLTLAFSSHDVSFIQNLSDRIYYLENGGLVEECDLEVEDPASKEKIGQFLFPF